MRILILSHVSATLLFALPAFGEISARETSVPKKEPAEERITRETDAPPETETATDVPTESQSVRMGDIFSEQERAQGMDPYMSEKKKKADEYFKRGVLLYEGEDYASAAEAFQVAYETLPHPAVLGNIAMCYDSAGKVPEAVTYYRRYFEEPVTSSKNDTMAERLKVLSALVSELQIACNQDCEIRVDGIARGNSTARVVVMPGPHRVEGVVDDSVVVSEIIALEARQPKAVQLDIPSAAPKVIAPAVSLPVPVVIPNDDNSGYRPGAGFWFSSGMTVVSLSLVTAFGTMTLNKKADYRASGWSDADSKAKGERYKTTTNAMIGLSGASAAAALLFAISDLNSRQKKKRVAVEPAAAAGVGVAVSF